MEKIFKDLLLHHNFSTFPLLLDIYVKVTLYEGGRVIKAKKTRQLSCSEVLDFNEKFSIRLPASYLDNVSCLVSLCSRNKYGLKAVMGRTNVGPFAFANGQGNQLGPGRNWTWNFYCRLGALAGDDSVRGGGCQVAQNDFQFQLIFFNYWIHVVWYSESKIIIFSW